MSYNLKVLEETIIEIEEKIKDNPDPFLENLLERLRIYKENSILAMYDKAKNEYKQGRDYKTIGGFRGLRIS